MAEVDVRAELKRLVEERGDGYAALSRLLGRNPAYLQQFVQRGSPRRLAEDDRRTLARYFGIDEERLGGAERSTSEKGLILIRRLAIGASAGPGVIADNEHARAALGVDGDLLRALGAGPVETLSLIRVEGDSMMPTLADGDEILVDGGAAAKRPRDGVFVLRLEDALMVKRLAVNPASGRIDIRSDNAAYPSWADCDPRRVTVIGRVIWRGGRL